MFLIEKKENLLYQYFQYLETHFCYKKEVLTTPQSVSLIHKRILLRVNKNTHKGPEHDSRIIFPTYIDPLHFNTSF